MKFCPQCHLLLERAECEGAAFWACRSCGGCWFAAADLRAALGANPARLQELDRLFPGVASADIFTGLPRPCPDCRSTVLERRPLPEAPPAAPLTCGACGGAWLEPGEPGLRKREDETLPSERAPSVEAEPPALVAEPDETAPEPAPREEAVAWLPPVALPEADAIAPPFVAHGAGAGGASEQAAVEPATGEGSSGPPVAPAERPTETRGVPLPPIVLPAMTSATATPRPDPEPTQAMIPGVRPEVVAESRQHPVPLTGEAMPTPPGIRLPERAERWCPQCRRGFPADVSACPDCRIGLAEGGYRVRCLQCNHENLIAAERCWQCRADLHPPELAQARPPIVRLPDEADVSRWMRANMPPAPGSGSCSTSALLILAGLLLSLLRLVFGG